MRFKKDPLWRKKTTKCTHRTNSNFFSATASLAQQAERSAVNRKVTGSIPVGSAFLRLFAVILVNAPLSLYFRVYTVRVNEENSIIFVI